MRKFSLYLLLLGVLLAAAGCGGGGGASGGVPRNPGDPGSSSTSGGANSGSGSGGTTAGTVTKDFAATDPAVFVSGYLEDVMAGTPARSARRLASSGCRLDVAVKGTRCILNCFATAAQSLKITIDDGPPRVTAPTLLNAWTTLTLFNGLPDTLHHVTIQQVNAYPAALVDRDAMLTVQGAAPALQPMSAYAPGAWGSRAIPLVQNGVVAPGFLAEAGTFTPGTRDGYPGLLMTGTYPDGTVILRAKATAAYAWVGLNGSLWQATIDGTDYPVTPTYVANTYDWLCLAKDLRPDVEHVIVIRSVRPRLWAALGAVMLPGGDLSSTPPPKRPGIMAMGHSIVSGSGLPNITDVYYHLIAQKHDYAVASRGVGFSTLRRYDTTDPPLSTLSGEARIGEIISVQPDICLIDYFVNDFYHAQLAPAASLTTFKTVLQNYLATLLQRCPNTQFVVLGILDNTLIPSDPAPWNAAIEAIVRAQNSLRCRFVSQTGWIDPATDLIGGIHPNVQGHQKLAAHLEPILFP